MVPALMCPALQLALDTTINGYCYLGCGPSQKKFTVSERVLHGFSKTLQSAAIKVLVFHHLFLSAFSGLQSDIV